ncbi:MAG: hypothetical protein COA96_13560 [SAR86 cluster bacterium]|uniref:Prolyl 4-hydroxylase alpha subunit Fe(2+) 2OG dioxygenase domain-containing protein n=1 Tax=SAR86 cluster bacterium TaxID=2030880 RepID=A0A2A5ATS3_9GAMM|nr:MAG: hypothetical protein COA96_13560 [SAR86 cluster bacterium]
MSAKIINIFTTPIMIFDTLISDSAINNRLKELALEKYENTENIMRSNKKGWESAQDFHTWDDDAVRTLRKAMHNVFLQLSAHETKMKVTEFEMAFRESALVNVGKRGAYHVPHIHRNCSWSAVYYIDVPTKDEDRAGELELLDPRTNPIITGITKRKSAISITPKTGMAVCFPSWLEHWVHPWNSDEARISVAWNITITSLKKKSASESKIENRTQP